MKALGTSFSPWSGCCFSAKHTTLRRKSKDWSRNQVTVSEWSNISTRVLLFHWTSTIKIQLSVWSSTKRTSSSFHWKLTYSRHDIAEKLLSWRKVIITHSLLGVESWRQLFHNWNKSFIFYSLSLKLHIFKYLAV